MKTLLLSVAILVAQSASAESHLLITERINAESISKEMPVADRKVLKSGDGRKKQSWSIKGVDIGHIEIIGNDQSDADQAAMRCAAFDRHGNAASPVPEASACHRLFVKLLSGFTTTPERFAKNLIEESAKSGVTESRRLGDLSFETDGTFYFVRRWSRLLNR